MLKNQRRKLVSVILVFAGVFVSCKNGNEKLDSGKEIKVTYLGIKSDYENYFAPGEKIEILARANKRSNVDIEWQLDGEWKKIDENRIVWTVPSEEGKYTIGVKAVDNENQKFSEKSMEIMVSDNLVSAKPDTFKCTVETGIRIKNKLLGDELKKTTSVIDMRQDGSVYVETIESNGEVTRSCSDEEAFYSINPDGKRELISRRNPVDETIPHVKMIGLSALINSGADYTNDGRTYTFTQNSETKSALVEYDSKLGVITRIRNENIENMEVSDIEMEYDVLDGFIVPKKIKGTVTYKICGELFSTEIEQEIKDVVINEGVTL